MAVNHIYIDNILNHACNIDVSNLWHTVFKIETIKLTSFFVSVQNKFIQTKLINTKLFNIKKEKEFASLEVHKNLLEMFCKYFVKLLIIKAYAFLDIHYAAKANIRCSAIRRVGRACCNSVTVTIRMVA